MSKSLSKFNYFGEFKSLQSKVSVLGRTVKILSKLLEINKASEMISKEIDESVIISFGENSPEELNGLLISDPTNHYLLIRQNNVWKKVKVE